MESECCHSFMNESESTVSSSISGPPKRNRSDVSNRWKRLPEASGGSGPCHVSRLHHGGNPRVLTSRARGPGAAVPTADRATGDEKRHRIGGHKQNARAKLRSKKYDDIATRDECITSSSKKLLVTRTLLLRVVTSAYTGRSSQTVKLHNPDELRECRTVH